MPRLVTERLEGYSFVVALQPSVDGDETAVVAELVFVDDSRAPTHSVGIPLTADGKRGLIKALTGGIEIASQAPQG